MNDKAINMLKKQMSNPANFGIAKSFVMMGMERGYDMQSQEDLDEWTKTYNAELAAGKIAPPVILPALRSPQQSREDLASRIHNQPRVLGIPTATLTSKKTEWQKPVAKGTAGENS